MLRVKCMSVCFTHNRTHTHTYRYIFTLSLSTAYATVACVVSVLAWVRVVVVLYKNRKNGWLSVNAINDNRLQWYINDSVLLLFATRWDLKAVQRLFRDKSDFHCVLVEIVQSIQNYQGVVETLKSIHASLSVRRGLFEYFILTLLRVHIRTIEDFHGLLKPDRSHSKLCSASGRFGIYKLSTEVRIRDRDELLLKAILFLAI